jgi:small-conductance mechanosensitive channel
MTTQGADGSNFPSVGENVIRRILWLTPTIGIAASGAALLLRREDWAGGLLVGTALAWLNFRWLGRGLRTFLADVAGTPELAARPTTARTYFAALFRYVLIGVGVYVIFTYLHFPLVSIVTGLCALGAATLTASLWEVVFGRG